MKPLLGILGHRADTILLLEGWGEPVDFTSLRDAEEYLSYWLNDGGSMSRLRNILHDLGHSRVVGRCSDREVVEALAARLVAGSLQLREKEVKRTYLNVSAAFSHAAAQSRPPAAPKTVLQPLPTTPPAAVVAAVPLLPLLVEVQIEGAEVLPEILQTLEQVNASLGTLDLASLSLEPTPSGVAQITDAMKNASDSVTSSLGDL